MLNFTSLGGSGFSCAGGDKPLIVFPVKGKGSGKDSITLLSKPEENPAKSVISWPGEYNAAGISIRGIGQADGQHVSHVVEVDGHRCAFLAAPLMEWTDTELALLGEVDILVIPSDNVKLIQKLVDELDPRILILTPDAAGKIDPEVIRICGAQGKARVSEFKIKGSLQAEGREVVLLGE